MRGSQPRLGLTHIPSASTIDVLNRQRLRRGRGAEGAGRLEMADDAPNLSRGVIGRNALRFLEYELQFAVEIEQVQLLIEMPAHLRLAQALARQHFDADPQSIAPLLHDLPLANLVDEFKCIFEDVR